MIMTRSDCYFCTTKESAFAMFADKFCCADCLIKLDKKQKEDARKQMMEAVNGN